MNYACLSSRESRAQQGGYMTPNDFKRYFAARRRVSGHTEAEPNSEPECVATEHGCGKAGDGALAVSGRPALKAERENTATKPSAVSSLSTSLADRFGRAGKLIAAIEKKLGGEDIVNKTIKLADEWIAVDPKEYRAESTHKKIPYQTMLMILTLSLSLLLIVSGSVLTSKAQMELRATKNQLGELVEYKEELEQKLEIKNDLKYIEEVARTRLGMIDKKYAPLRYLGSEPEEKVVIYDTRTSDARFGLSTLLSALGIPD